MDETDLLAGKSLPISSSLRNDGRDASLIANKEGERADCSPASAGLSARVHSTEEDLWQKTAERAEMRRAGAAVLVGKKKRHKQSVSDVDEK